MSYSYHPPFVPTYDWGHWNKRWGTNLPPPPGERYGARRVTKLKKKVETTNIGRGQWEETKTEYQQLQLTNQ